MPQLNGSNEDFFRMLNCTSTGWVIPFVCYFQDTILSYILRHTNIIYAHSSHAHKAQKVVTDGLVISQIDNLVEDTVLMMLLRLVIKRMLINCLDRKSSISKTT